MLKLIGGALGLISNGLGALRKYLGLAQRKQDEETGAKDQRLKDDEDTIAKQRKQMDEAVNQAPGDGSDALKNGDF